jgi:putative endopeptidase
MDEKAVNSLGYEPIKKDLEHALAVGLENLSKTLGEYSAQGISGFFGWYVDNDPGNPQRYLANLYQGGLGLPDESYYRDEKYKQFTEQYIPYIAKMFSLAGFSETESFSIAELVFAFEKALASVHWEVVNLRDAEKTYNLRTFEQLQSISSNFNFSEWMSGSGLAETFLSEVVVMTPSYFEGMGKLLTEENLKSIRYWLAWQVINSAAPFLSDEFVNARFDFYGKTLTGQPELKARWKRAVASTESTLGEAIGQIYVKKFFPEAAKARMDELVGWLVEAYRQSISNLDWMSDETKAKALEKLGKFNPKIGYPKKWKDYSDLEIKRDDLIGNLRRANAWYVKEQSKKIGAPIDRDEWFMTPQTVNAYYNPGFNEIVFPAAILQPPFFNMEADDAVNFAAIGGVIGHEIGHGFDDQGSKYDGDGALKSWWTDEDRKRFEDRTRILIEQYGELVPLGLDSEYKVNGELTIGENIGDLGGIMIAYKAYILSLEGKEPPVINGVSANERFLYSWAQIWRGKSRDAIAIQRLATDPHSPAEFRCNQVVRNFDVYYSTFGVSEGDAMWLAPEKRVTIW